MGRSFIFGAIGILLLGVSGEAARAEPSDSGIDALRLTRYTDIVLDAQGLSEMSRRFDESGRLVAWTWTDRSTQPPSRESFRADGYPETRTLEHYSGRTLTRRQVDYLNLDGVGVRREIYWSSTGSGHVDRLDETRATSRGLAVSLYRLDGDRRIVISSATRPATLEFDKTDDYASCLTHNNHLPSAGSADCHAALNRLVDDEKLHILDPAVLVPIQCTDGDTLYLPEGFRVDLKSCTGAARDQVIQGARQAGAMASCLNKVNPQFAKTYVTTLQSSRPLIHCASSPGFDQSQLPGCGSSRTDAGACADAKARVSSAGAFVDPTLSTDQIYLGRNDPTLSPQPNAADANIDTAAGTLFHESLHLSGHEGGAHHNDPDYGDEVYGCQAICGSGGSTLLTAEGCRACVLGYPPDLAAAKRAAFPGTNSQPDPGMLASCSAFPAEASVKKLKAARDLQRLLFACNAEFNDRNYGGPACTRLRASPDFASCVKSDKNSNPIQICAALGGGCPPPHLSFCLRSIGDHLGKSLAADWNTPAMKLALQTLRAGQGDIKVGAHSITAGGMQVGSLSLTLGAAACPGASAPGAPATSPPVESVMQSLALYDGFCAAVAEGKTPAQARQSYQGVSPPSPIVVTHVTCFTNGWKPRVETLATPVMDPHYQAGSSTADFDNSTTFCQQIQGLESQYYSMPSDVTAL